VWGSGCIDPRFLDLGTSWRLMVSFKPRPLYPRGKSHRYPLDRRLGGPQSRSERHEEVNILALIGDSKSDPLVAQPVASRYTDCAIPALDRRWFRPERSYDSQWKTDRCPQGDSERANGRTENGTSAETWKGHSVTKSSWTGEMSWEEARRVWQEQEEAEKNKEDEEVSSCRNSRGRLEALKVQSPCAQQGSVNGPNIPGQSSRRPQFNGGVTWALQHRRDHSGDLFLSKRLEQIWVSHSLHRRCPDKAPLNTHIK
jgi:hypothetical protein